MQVESMLAVHVLSHSFFQKRKSFTSVTTNLLNQLVNYLIHFTINTRA